VIQRNNLPLCHLPAIYLLSHDGLSISFGPPADLSFTCHGTFRSCIRPCHWEGGQCRAGCGFHNERSGLGQSSWLQSVHRWVSKSILIPIRFGALSFFIGCYGTIGRPSIIAICFSSRICNLQRISSHILHRYIDLFCPQNGLPVSQILTPLQIHLTPSATSPGQLPYHTYSLGDQLAF
jgi:hypothetical protein